MDIQNDTEQSVEVEDQQPSGFEDDGTTFYITVDRTTDETDPQVDYFRLGEPSNDAMYDATTSIEERITEVMDHDSFGSSQDNLVGPGRVSYSGANSSTLYEGDSFEQVSGKMYEIAGSKHEVIKQPNSSPYRIYGTMHAPLDLRSGTYYDLQEGDTYEYTANFAHEYTAGLTHKSERAFGIRSNAGLIFELNTGLSLTEFKARIKAMSKEASIDGRGNYWSPDLKVLNEDVSLAKDMVLVGLSDPLATTTWEKGIWLTLLALAHAANASFSALNIAVGITMKDYQESPEKLHPYILGMRTVSIVQGVLGFIFLVAVLIKEQWFNKVAKSIKRRDGNPLLGKPYLRFLPDDNGTIELSTGQGASITLKGDKIMLDAAGIELVSGGQARGDKDGISIVATNGPLSAASTHRDGATFMGTDGPLNLGGLGVQIASHDDQDIKTFGSKLTHAGEFQAGNTTLGDTVMTSYTANGQPVGQNLGNLNREQFGGYNGNGLIVFDDDDDDVDTDYGLILYGQ